MSARTEYAAGDPCWVDLLAPDIESAKRFYGEVLGWDAGEQSEEFGNYMMFFKEGAPVAGAVPAPPGQEQMSAWTVYLSVNDTDDAVARAAANGASVLLTSQQVGDLGSMALLSDPAGAVIGLWAPDQFQGLGRYDEIGAPKWFEHHSRDFAGAVEFYKSSFDWDILSVSDTDDFRYSTANHGDTQFAGLMDSSSFLPESVPAHWTIYFGVSDVDATCAVVERLGGRVDQAAEDTPYGRLASVSDMRGATLRLMQS